MQSRRAEQAGGSRAGSRRFTCRAVPAGRAVPVANFSPLTYSLEETMEHKRSSKRNTESLLTNVFNYELGMMKENLETHNRFVSTTELLKELCAVDVPNEHVMSYEITQDVQTLNSNVIGQNEKLPLLTNLWNYDLRMMKDKVNVNKQKQNRVPPLKRTTPTAPNKKQRVVNPKIQFNPSTVSPGTPEVHLQLPKTRTPLSPVSNNIMSDANDSKSHRIKSSYAAECQNTKMTHFGKSQKTFTQIKPRSHLSVPVQNAKTPVSKSSTLCDCKSNNVNSSCSPLYCNGLSSFPNSQSPGYRKFPKPFTQVTLSPQLCYSKTEKRKLSCYSLSSQCSGSGKNTPPPGIGKTPLYQSKKTKTLPVGKEAEMEKKLYRPGATKHYEGDIDYSFVVGFDSDDSESESDRDLYIPDHFEDGEFTTYEIQTDASKDTQTNHSRLYNKGKQPMEIPLRKLDFNGNERDTSTMDFNDDIEYAHITDFRSDQSDGDSEYEMGEDVDYEHFEMQTQAENGKINLSSRIHAFIAAPIFPQFEKKLEEGQIYELQTFKVKTYNGDETNRAVRNDKHIYFTADTNLEKETIPGIKIPKHSFDLFNLEDMEAMKNDNRFLTDIVAVIEDVQPKVCYTKNSEEKSHVPIVISDGRTTLNVTFFNELGNNFLETYQTADTKPVIIIIAFVKVTEWKDVLNLTNFPATRFYLNTDHSAVDMLRQRLAMPNFYVMDIDDDDDEEVCEVSILKISEIRKLNEAYVEKKVACEITVKKFDEKMNWYSPFCIECDEDINEVDGKYFCTTKTCQRNYPYPDKRFRLYSLCSDDTGTIPIVWPDDEICRLTGKTVYDVEAEEFEVEGCNKIPELLKSFEKKTYKITIILKDENLKQGSKVYMASNISNPIEMSGNHSPTQNVNVDVKETELTTISAENDLICKDFSPPTEKSSNKCRPRIYLEDVDNQAAKEPKLKNVKLEKVNSLLNN
ncbi:hypothetical protein POM88_046500 [Heracleum sosnowskyi]|uniref:Replication factor A C-terminal domain-containing protein n=1 Tax=Heracleum sosnowskyi TaxID=360622 RepID=A0AAD8M631_9APIA|nr:hypothetical protein POM88_046500 [Heracleum sosnowskyi]